MDGSTIEHSDSDSGDSWTILENIPVHDDDDNELRNNHESIERPLADNSTEKDEDTDGISIISDSDPESSPCEATCEKCLSEDNHVSERSTTPSPVNIFPSIYNDNKIVNHEDILLGENGVKYKTYVHRRNKRLSTVLNIIMLGSVITAAGVAIGHMWGAKNECTVPNPSVNKILSNLYKLQEENAYLRDKLKEVSLTANLYMAQQKKSPILQQKQKRCKKMYEEPLDSKNADKAMRCVDKENNNINPTDNDKQFYNDIEKLKNIYDQNKSWLDVEISKRMKHELNKNNVMVTKGNGKAEDIENHNTEIQASAKLLPDKISYAESVKTNPQIVPNGDTIKESKENMHMTKKKYKKREKKLYQNSSEEDLKKDDRYLDPLSKKERKKRDTQKIHNKKQKRKNKYEQWELKGGYKKDYDDISSSSSQDNVLYPQHTDKEVPTQDFRFYNYDNKVTDNDSDSIKNDNLNPRLKHLNDYFNKFGLKFDKDLLSHIVKDKDISDWYDKRGTVRADARKRLENALHSINPNKAEWYFRRMQKREQCRTQVDNSTFKKFSKQKMNFKMKH